MHPDRPINIYSTLEILKFILKRVVVKFQYDTRVCGYFRAKVASVVGLLSFSVIDNVFHSLLGILKATCHCIASYLSSAF